MDTKTAALADLDATLRNLDEARKALEAGDLGRLTTALRARQWVFPESVWRAHREMREAQVSSPYGEGVGMLAAWVATDPGTTFDPAPERVQVPPAPGPDDVDVAWALALAAALKATPLTEVGVINGSDTSCGFEDFGPEVRRG